MNCCAYPDEYSETVTYPKADLSVKSWKASDKDFPTLSAVNHWHNDIEFAYALKGGLFYNVDGDIIELKQGQLLFINSGHMHFGFQKEKRSNELICMIFHPSLIVSAATEKYLDFICGEKSMPYALFLPDTLSGKAIIDLVLDVHSQISAEKPDKEFELLGSLYILCGKLMNYFRNAEIRGIQSEKYLEAMHKMTGFIQKNYQSRISIGDIAEAGFVCRSRCCEIFKKYLGKTPNEYLTEYRISKGIEMLKNPNFSVTDISYACGFNSASYFSETFAKLMNCSPVEYRKKYYSRR